MRALAEGVERPAAEEVDETGMIAALASSPAQLDRVDSLEWAPVQARPEDLVVMVGAGELGPYGSSRTRFEVEVSDELSAAGILELAWTTGLVAWDTNAGGWYDTESQESVDEADSPTATKRQSARPVASAATSTTATWSTTQRRC